MTIFGVGIFERGLRVTKYVQKKKNCSIFRVFFARKNIEKMTDCKQNIIFYTMESPCYAYTK